MDMSGITEGRTARGNSEYYNAIKGLKSPTFAIRDVVLVTFSSRLVQAQAKGDVHR